MTNFLVFSDSNPVAIVAAPSPVSAIMTAIQNLPYLSNTSFSYVAENDLTDDQVEAAIALNTLDGENVFSA